jgi:hypothetical protein
MLDDYCHLGGLSGIPFFGATTIVLTSASSKTAFSLAFILKQRGIEVIGLTSPKNVQFCENLDLYDSVVTYDQVNTLNPDSKTVVVDMAGSLAVELDLDKHLGKNLMRNIGVGLTHNTAMSGRKILSDHANEVREFFFAP